MPNLSYILHSIFLSFLKVGSPTSRSANEEESSGDGKLPNKSATSFRHAILQRVVSPPKKSGNVSFIYVFTVILYLIYLSKSVSRSVPGELLTTLKESFFAESHADIIVTANILIYLCICLFFCAYASQYYSSV